MVKEVLVSSNPDEAQKESGLFIAGYLQELLGKGRVMVMLSGGSAVSMYRTLFEELIKTKPDLSGLTASLFDERYVEPGNKDSNEQQLRDAGVIGLLEERGAKWVGYLVDAKEEGPTVAERVSTQFAELREHVDYWLILAGLGDDAHTAGLLPTEDDGVIEKVYKSNNLVEYYELPDEVVNPYRERLTSTPALIRMGDEVIVYAVGEKKRNAIELFKAKTQPINRYPATALYESKLPVVLVTDIRS